MQRGPNGLDKMNELRLLEQGPQRQLAPRCCSGGVSSINGASESRPIHNRSTGLQMQ